MGTKHGYTEKKCKVCGKTKKRADFPAFGGLTCRECIRVKDREKGPDRWKSIKNNPTLYEKEKKKSRETMRRLKQRKKDEGK